MTLTLEHTDPLPDADADADTIDTDAHADADADADAGPGAPMIPAHAREHALRDLGTRIQEHAARIAQDECAFLQLIAEFDAENGCACYIGLKSTAHWLAWACSMSPGTAREHVRIARTLRTMPHTVDEFAAGRLSYSKIREITRIADLVDEDELIRLARRMTAAQLARTVAGYRTATGTRMAQDVARQATWTTREDGMIEVRALLPAEEGAEITTALDLALHHDDTEPTDDDPSTGPGATGRALPETTLEHRKADALVQLARTYLDTAPTDRTGNDRHLVIVQVDAAALTDDQPDHAQPDPAITSTDTTRAPVEEPADVPAGTWYRTARAADGNHCGILGGGRLEALTAQRLACTGQVALSVIDDDGEILYLGRRKRLATPAQRRALRLTQNTCQFPGCHQTRHLDVHHIIPWAQGGTTDIDQLALLCRRHHVLVHEGGLHLTPTPAGDVNHFDVLDSNNTPVQALWDPAFDEATIRPLHPDHDHGHERTLDQNPVAAPDTGRSTDHGVPAGTPTEPHILDGDMTDETEYGPTRIFPIDAGADFHLADCVQALIHAPNITHPTHQTAA
jgi:hypothetical protein